MRIFNVLEYGVIKDSVKLQTEQFQSVIDKCHEAGGGEIQVPTGIYYVSSLRLYSNMSFHLMENAELRGSRHQKDYIDFHVPTTLRYLYDDYYIRSWNLPPYYIYGILCAFDEDNISIIGEKGSVIDGQDCFDKHGEEHFRGPMGIILSQCNHIELSGYTFKDCANWSHQIDSCKHVRAKNVTILAGHDGFNLHHCDDIQIKDCNIKTGDDCFAGYDVKNLYVDNCYLNTACNVMRIGGTNLIFDHCTIEGPATYPHLGKKTYHTHRLFKYYSMRPDTIAKEGEILIRNSIMKGVPALGQYEYGEEKYMQNNLPLKEFALENTKIEGLSEISTFKGKGNACKISLKDCVVKFENNLNENNFLDIDECVEFHTDNVQYIYE